MKCLFVSDLHGSKYKINSLFKLIKSEKPDGVFIGGDIFPNNHIEDINSFFDNYYINNIKELIKNKIESKIFIILGNDDPRIYENLLFEAEKKGYLSYVNFKSVEFFNLFVVGYPYVPPTPFILKDWERYDVSRYVDPGSLSPEGGKRSFEINLNEEKYKTISEDLFDLSKKSDPKKTIYLFHSPPYQTNLDRADLDDKKFDHVQMDVHVGSIAIKRFIDRVNPFLTLHGHVHESSRLSGDWKSKFGNTFSFSAAYEGDKLAVIFFDTDNLNKAFRKII